MNLDHLIDVLKVHERYSLLHQTDAPSKEYL